MTNIAILGSSWGDEGKGHVTHHLSPKFDWVIRFGGGANAGHTIYRDGVKYVHNLMPSFDWRSQNTKAFLGAGMVIDLEQLHKEVLLLLSVDPSLPSRVYVDPDAFIVLPEHKDEDKKNNGHIGSTNRGIGPAYKSKIGREGFRIKNAMEGASQSRYWIEQLKSLGVHFKHALELKRQMERQNLLFEGAQGVMLDINHGVYPYISCGDATVAGIFASGFAWVKLDKVYGVAKCYLTKVGEGPFPTEVFGKEAETLRELGKEYGATTGRPRRIGYLDLPALDYACKKGGITHLIITKFDILNGLDTVKLCIAYQKTPVCPEDFFKATPQYIDIEGWKDAKDISQLDEFISKVETFTGCPVEYVSCGVEPGDILLR